MVNITRCDKREKNGKAFYIFHAVDDEGYTASIVCSESYRNRLLEADPKSIHIGWNRDQKKNFLYIK